jgi:methylenetetrahydrofolate dehydrogenase (NADP+)/methenyltetrahydrofolate cyclohydrolase
MPGRVLDGKLLAQTMQAEIHAEVQEHLRRHTVPPGLAAVLVGDDPASHLYVKNKCAACQKVGIASFRKDLPGTTTQADLLALIDQLNRDPAVHGILVQLPLPRHIDTRAILNRVDPHKDVDALGPENAGLLASGTPRYLPCTPAGIHQLLVRNGIDIPGSHAVIVGRSNLVGKPLALILLRDAPDCNATVTVCHTKTGYRKEGQRGDAEALKAITRQADLLVAAAGRVPNFITADMVRPGAVVVDVGTHKLPDGKWTGDVDYPAVREVASAITPVPGGVGPMTITMLLKNTLKAAQLACTSHG